MPSSGMTDSDINGKKNIPLVKHPLINTNLFPGKAALEENVSTPTPHPLPTSKRPGINLENFPFSFKEY